MKSFLVAVAALAAAVVQPASAATLIDYDVYAAGSAYISGGSYGDIASGSFTNANGSGGGNFTSRVASNNALTADAHTLSAYFAGLTATGTLTSGQYTPNAATLVGSTSGINVFTIDGARWSQLYALSFSGLGSGAIVNIVGGGDYSNFINLNFGGLAAENVLFNFVDASSITMNGWNVGGTVLAPDAFLTLRGGSVAGSVIVDGFHSEGSTIGGHAFTGLAATTAVPEPASWAMMIVGFGMVGAALRRRRRGAIAALAV
ncbi:MAG: choice-of-anchor A family protein [Sphingomonas sp.]|uniref:choice-of-anchor A family protein n=1 Tax=Sphingomonas sp. TaxID=28214 RepID=UPI001ACFFB6E|nr:choice-of-anchor A family protein [Sphingomonas sp.]MBN8816664.1 choice-of-anchor A family protein [Sphingomonas sp.]